MSARKAQKKSIPARLIPECEQWAWLVKPDLDVDGDRGKGYPCRQRAAYTVTFIETGPVLTQHTCLAHLADLLDRAERSRRAARIIWKVDYPDPNITELTIAVDTRAAAHGRRRFIRFERIVTGPIALALVADQRDFPAVPTPRPHRADGARRSGPPIRSGSQGTLF